MTRMHEQGRIQIRAFRLRQAVFGYSRLRFDFIKQEIDFLIYSCNQTVILLTNIPTRVDIIMKHSIKCYEQFYSKKHNKQVLKSK